MWRGIVSCSHRKGLTCSPLTYRRSACLLFLMLGGLDYDIKINAVAEAHLAAMRAGDQQLSSEADRKILHALVARSAAEMAYWIKTRVPEGDRRAALLTGLSTELQKKDVVGKGLATIEKNLTSQANAAVGVAAGTASAPAWWASAVGLVIGFFGFIVHVGNDFGAIIAFLIFAVAGLHIHPGVRVAVYRTLSGASRAVGSAVSSAGNSAMYFWNYPGTIGVYPESIFIQHVGPSSDSLRGQGFAVRESHKFMLSLRAIGQVVVALAFIALIVSLIVFIIGFYHGFIQQTQTCEQQYPGTSCGFSR